MFINQVFHTEMEHKLLESLFSRFRELPLPTRDQQPTLLSVNFSKNDVFQPYLLQCGYDPEKEIHFVIEHPESNHFSNATINIKNDTKTLQEVFMFYFSTISKSFAQARKGQLINSDGEMIFECDFQ